MKKDMTEVAAKAIFAVTGILMLVMITGIVVAGIYIAQHPHELLRGIGEMTREIVDGFHGATR